MTAEVAPLPYAQWYRGMKGEPELVKLADRHRHPKRGEGERERIGNLIVLSDDQQKMSIDDLKRALPKPE